MRLRRILLTLLLAVGLLAVGSVAALAATNDFGLGGASHGTNLPKGGVTEIIARIIKIALSFVSVLFLLLTLYAGFLWMTARGDEKKVKTAKDLLVGAVVGMIIVASAYTITSFVVSNATSSVQPGPPPPPAAKSVPLGGDCTESDQCADNLAVCDDTKKCVSVVDSP